MAATLSDPAVSSQEYRNPAFVPDSFAEENSSTDGATVDDSSSSPRTKPLDALPFPVGDAGRRRSSVADIAVSLKPSLVEWIGARYFRRSNYFRHPFGNSTSVMEKLFSLEAKSDDRYMTSGTQSPARLVIWIVFTIFMIGVAGAIILGAESYKGKPRDTNSTQTLCNATDVIGEPG